MFAIFVALPTIQVCLPACLPGNAAPRLSDRCCKTRAFPHPVVIESVLLSAQALGSFYSEQGDEPAIQLDVKLLSIARLLLLAVPMIFQVCAPSRNPATLHAPQPSNFTRAATQQLYTSRNPATLHASRRHLPAGRMGHSACPPLTARGRRGQVMLSFNVNRYTGYQGAAPPVLNGHAASLPPY
jgi:hypothetical protein